jgi:hypothetical protein
MWVYEINLNNKIIGDSGDLNFNTKSEALADAQDYIIYLSKEYKCDVKDCDIYTWEE